MRNNQLTEDLKAKTVKEKHTEKGFGHTNCAVNQKQPTTVGYSDILNGLGEIHDCKSSQ